MLTEAVVLSVETRYGHPEQFIGAGRSPRAPRPSPPTGACRTDQHSTAGGLLDHAVALYAFHVDGICCPRLAEKKTAVGVHVDGQSCGHTGYWM